MSEAKSSRTLTGRVVSNKREKTNKGLIQRKVAHHLYGKFVKRSTKVHAHDENNECQEGDVVTVAECRPLSKSKSWKLVEVVTRAS